MKNITKDLSVRALFLVVFLVIPISLFAQGLSQEERFARAKGTLVTSRGEQYVFQLEVARTEKQQARGLMHRRQLDADAAMLFEFDTPLEVTVWMKNTWISLDVLFVDEGGTIQKIVRHTTPFSLKEIASDSAVLYVLELNAGTVDRVGIQVGDSFFLINP